MTPRTKDALSTIGAAIAAGVFGAGVIWGATRAEISGKLDTPRFVADSLHRERQNDAVLYELRAQRAMQEETLERVREIACPPAARGCR